MHLLDDVLHLELTSSGPRHDGASCLQDLSSRAVAGGARGLDSSRERRDVNRVGRTPRLTNVDRRWLHLIREEREAFPNGSSHDAPPPDRRPDPGSDGSGRCGRQRHEAIDVEPEVGSLVADQAQPVAPACGVEVADQAVIEQLHDPAVVCRHGGHPDEVAEQLTQRHGVRRDAAAAITRELELDHRPCWRVDDEVQLAAGYRRVRDLDSEPVR
ncbi:MAG TPA: hypothetical protein VEA99_05095 [Gemmatimonadaceae bacterium]|nr:hypothetical protein [Gemmatimonadaceae bacterium]